jgi:hypothetical protein
MAARDKSRFTTAQAGWIALAIFGGWLVFLFLPVSRKPKAPTSTVLLPTSDSILESVGLARNPDWTGLPEYFAVWADSLEWRDGKTAFAYWNPGSQSYSYFFEATRREDRYFFRALSRKESAAAEGLVIQALGKGRESDTHPFVFWRSDEPTVIFIPGKPGMKIVAPPPPSVKVDLPVKPLPIPPPPPPKSESH